MENGGIYKGRVVHARITPVTHKLNYGVFSLLLDVDQLAKAATNLRLFSLDGFGLLSLHQRDHGYRDHRSLATFAADQIESAGLTGRVERTMMLFYPRILGLAFNPLTVYFCCDAAGRPLLMIYEVRNTFGEDTTYVLPAGPERSGVWSHDIEKAFYVSPFNRVEGDYTFHVTAPGDALTVGVALKDAGRPILRTHFRATRTALTDANLARAFAGHPLMTAKIVGGIHWEALKLWRKGMSLQERPAPPQPPIIAKF